MSGKSRISFGPGAASIILIVVVLSMSVLGLLSWVNARNDMKLCDRSAQMVEAVYTLNAQAEEQLKELSELTAKTAAQLNTGSMKELCEALAPLLPGDVSIDEDMLAWTQADDYRNLECAARITLEGNKTHLEWVTHRMTMRTEETWDLGGSAWNFGSF